MDGLSTVERLRLLLQVEETTSELTAIPADTYTKLSNYAQKLRATTGLGDNEVPGRLARKQLWLMEVMTRRLLQVRLAKAQKEGASTRDDGQPRPSPASCPRSDTSRRCLSSSQRRRRGS